MVITSTMVYIIWYQHWTTFICITGGCGITDKECLLQSAEVETSNEKDSSQVLSSADLQWGAAVKQQRVCVCEREAEGTRRQGSALAGAKTVTSQHKHTAIQVQVLSLHTLQLYFLKYFTVI